MPLQNRVDPFGQLHANPSRGLFMGNRGGRLHDPLTKRLFARRWTNKSWIICACAFKDRRRAVWGTQQNGRPSYTELFFLDEVTALAAGHRPCFECRRQAAKAYALAFAETTGGVTPRVREIDEPLHAQRLAAGAKPRLLTHGEVDDLPDGAMVADGAQVYATRSGMALPWSFDGYGAAAAFSQLTGDLTLITPASTVVALCKGYRPVWHPSAQR
jgi:hypothetical protein